MSSSLAEVVPIWEQSLGAIFVFLAPIFDGTMNERPQVADGERSSTVNEAAAAIGVDVFTMLSLIQRGKVNPGRSSSGEITIPEGELAKLMKKRQ